MWPNLAKSLFEMIATSVGYITKLEKVTLVVGCRFTLVISSVNDDSLGQTSTSNQFSHKGQKNKMTMEYSVVMYSFFFFGGEKKVIFSPKFFILIFLGSHFYLVLVSLELATFVLHF